MAIQTVVAFISVVYITVVISELSIHESKFKIETVEEDDDVDSGSGVGITNLFIEDRTLREDDVVSDEPMRNVGSLVPLDISEELATMQYRTKDDISVSPSNKEWSSRDENGLESALTQKPPFENLIEIKGEELSIYVFQRGGRKYFDISRVNVTELRLKNLRDVYGISAENGQLCKIKKLVIAENYYMDRNILNCHTLMNLTLSGRSWTCMQDWSWLEDLKTRGIELQSEAFCKELRIHTSKKYELLPVLFEEGIIILEKLGITVCPEKCSRCMVVLTIEKMFDCFRVHCENSSLTDSDVRSLPTGTTHLFLEHNKLRSTQKLFSHLEKLENITTVQLDHNQLDAIPFLKKGAFKKLNRLSLARNDIQKVDVEAFESIVNREDIVVFLQENLFPCDCTSHSFLKLCLKNVTKVNELIKFPLHCVNQTNGVRQLLTLRDECEPPISDPPDLMPLLLFFLAVMNVIFIYLVNDLVMAIRELRGQGSHVRDPKFHYLVKGTQRILRCLCRSRRGEGERFVDEASGGRGVHDAPVTIRTVRLSSLDRDSSTVRTDRRRLTPCPN